MDFVKHITVTVVTLAALGCSSEKREASSTTAQSSGEPGLEACSIIINKCSTCHMKGGSAPFALTTYEEIKKRGSAIAEVTSSRYMPPWLAQETTHAFADDKSLSKSEIQLIKLLLEFPNIIAKARDNLEPQTIATYLQSLAGLFHKYYAKERVVTDDKNKTSARLILVQTLQIVLNNGLSLLGIHALERM